MASENLQQSAKGSKDQVELYDFYHPNRIPKDHIETLNRIHERYSDLLSGSLSTFLRTNVEVKLDTVVQLAFQDYLKLLVNPTCIATFDMQPLNGYCAMEINAVLIFSMIDRMLGGDGKTPDTSRAFTDIETSICSKIIRIFLDGFSDSWKQMLTFNFHLKEVQTNPAFTRTIPMREICLVAKMKMTIGDTSGMVTVCLPYVNLEPIASKLKKEEWNSSFSTKQSQEVQEAHQKNFMTIDLELCAHLGKTELSMSDLLMLQPGDILNLGNKTRNPISITIGGIEKFKGVPGLCGRNKAVGIQCVVAE